MLLVAMITVRRDRLADFQRYETAAVAIMARHGGTLERALHLQDESLETAREVHVVRFVDAEAYDAYRADPELLALAPLRKLCVSATELWPAVELSYR